MKYALLLCLLAPPVAADCPIGTDYSADIVEIMQNMREAPSEASAQQHSAALWEIWLDAPDELAQAMLDEGLARNRMGDRDAARAKLTELIAYCPDYPEGYNQRAFAAFLQGDFEAALVDLEAAIALQPVHLGALTGKALTLIGMGRDDAAQEVLRSALALNPWLAERTLLIEPEGEDI